MDEIVVTGDPSRLPLLVTLDQLKRIYENQNTKFVEEAYPYLDQILYRYGITTKHEIAAFLAQVGHESAYLRYRKENLNYSAKALRRVFRKYFSTIALANAYARNPEKIANRVYASRMGNGPESSGDGWRYRGRGFIQLTGKNNYMVFAEDEGLSLDEAIQYLETMEGAWASAGWYWQYRDLDRFDDSPSLFKKLTKLINGGYNGLKHREEIYNRALKIL